MNYLYPALLIFSLFICDGIHAQQSPETGYYLVVPDSFSPPVRDMILSFEGFPATPFMANDMNQMEQNLGDFRGTLTLMLFWKIENVDAVSMLYDLNQLKKEYKDRITVIAMGEESRTEVEQFLGNNEMDLIIIPNTKMLGEAVYGAELGCPRLFVIDQSGIIRTVIPEAYFTSHGNHSEILENIVKSNLD